MRHLWKASFLLLGVATSVYAKSFRIEKDYSVVEFRIRHLVSMTEGHFEDFEGTLDYDPEHLSDAKVNVVIRPASVDTRNRKRDKHLRGKDFFDVGQFPTARFVSQSVRPEGSDRLKISGLLTLHGITRPVLLEATVRGQTQDAIGRARIGFAAQGLLNRKDFGMTWNETLDNGGLLLGDDVNIEIEIDAVQMD